MKDLSLREKIHLLWRAGFGPAYHQVQQLDELDHKSLYAELSTPTEYVYINFQKQGQGAANSYAKNANAERRRQIQKQNRQRVLDLNLGFLQEMVNGKNQLQEKMAFFWHGHFACRTVNPVYNRQLLQVIRKHALGNFRELLLKVSQSPAMLAFLNNQQNKKDHPNENFARELMELFTMGRGNYSETDIREAARAFTGWGFNRNGEFVERLNQHDKGTKAFLGQSGNFDGRDIIEIILKQPATAKFIVEKIYRFFVNEKINPQRIEKLAAHFSETDYDISSLMQEIFLSDWFYDPENMGNRIKSPIELMVGIMRIWPTDVQQPERLIEYQRLLGQVLLYPPNVSGWPNGKAWIDSSTLMLRLQIPQIWSGWRPMDYEARADDDLDMGMDKMAENLLKEFKDPKVAIHWEKLEQAMNGRNIQDYVLACKANNLEALKVQFDQGDLRKQIVYLMSTPEYQIM